MIIDKIINWIVAKALVILGALCVILLVYSVVVHYANKARISALKLEIEKKEQAINGFVLASKFQEQKLNGAIALANSEYKATEKEIEALEAGPVPKTAEEARKWALDALNGGRK